MTILKKLSLLIIINLICLVTVAASLDKVRKDSLENFNPTCASFIRLTDSLLTNTPCCQFKITGTHGSGDSIVVSFGDGSPNARVASPSITNPMNWTHSYCNPGTYTVRAYIYYTCMVGSTYMYTDSLVISTPCYLPLPPPPCYDCISSFAPIPGKKYLVSAWAKENNAPQSKTSYNYPSIDILYPSISGSAGPFSPSGNIIDGWQRIEGVFTIPATTTDLTLRLNCSTSDCYYDDVRVLPFDGSMKSYVYDPVNMRLVAELDERNYATLYEYDEEGKLIRVKKETENGKMTIKENRDNTKK
jgi:hypothetical protein